MTTRQWTRRGVLTGTIGATFVGPACLTTFTSTVPSRAMDPPQPLSMDTLGSIVSSSGRYTVFGSEGQPTRPNHGRVEIRYMGSFFATHVPVQLLRGAKGWYVTGFDVSHANGPGRLELTDDLRTPDFVAARAGKRHGNLVVDAPIAIARGSKIVVVNHISTRDSDSGIEHYTHGLDTDLADLVGPDRAGYLLFPLLEELNSAAIHVIPWGESGPDRSRMGYSVRAIRQPLALDFTFLVTPRTLV